MAAILSRSVARLKEHVQQFLGPAFVARVAADLDLGEEAGSGIDIASAAGG